MILHVTLPELADGNSCQVVLSNGHGVGLMTIYLMRAERDDVPLVELETEPALGEVDGEPRLRIYLNEACLHEKPPFPMREETADGDGDLSERYGRSGED